jgi:DNA-3-methyladenine glycosylase I
MANNPSILMRRAPFGFWMFNGFGNLVFYETKLSLIILQYQARQAALRFCTNRIMASSEHFKMGRIMNNQSASHQPSGKRCPWCGDDPLYVDYHDTEWGVPQHDDRTLFEFMLLEGAQAGLSWITVLRKRENFRQAFAGFDACRVAAFGEAETAGLLSNPGIIRNRAKIVSAIGNARAYLEVQGRFGSFDRYLWQFVDGIPVQNTWQHPHEVPAQTPLAEQLSRDLRQRGFNFVGPTICYAFMQAVGLVNDHLLTCFRHAALSEPTTAGRAATR